MNRQQLQTKLDGLVIERRPLAAKIIKDYYSGKQPDRVRYLAIEREVQDICRKLWKLKYA